MKYVYSVIILVFLVYSYGCTYEGTEVYTDEFSSLDSIIQDMESDLAPLEVVIADLAAHTASIYDMKEDLASRAQHDQYSESSTGVIFRDTLDPNFSSVHVSSISPNKEEALQQVYYTEYLDSAFRYTYASAPFVAQVYYNTPLQMCRIFPALDVLNVFDAEMNLPLYNFYYMADEVRNPQRKSKWLEDIYVDPAGRGWILSLIHPIYENEKLAGVLGIDITINDIIKRYLNLKNRKLLIIDGSGNIVAGTNEAIELLNLPPLRNHTYVQTINSDNFRKGDYNLFKSKSKEVRKMVAKFLLEKDNFYQIDDELSNNLYRVFCRQMNLLNWYILEIKA